MVDVPFYILLSVLDGVKVKGDDQKAGVEIIKKALQSAPIRQITSNAGVDGSVIVNVKLLEGKKGLKWI